MKATALIGLSFALASVSAANAATTTPVNDTFSVTAPARGESFDLLSFPQFNPSLGTLTSVDFSLNSVLGGGFAFGSSTAQITAVTFTGFIMPFGNSPGPYNFTDVSGLQSLLTTANYTGSGNIGVFVSLFNFFAAPGSAPATWTGDGPGQGLTLVYDYTPAATPLPAALPLFATGLGALGLLGWRRKRKARVSLLGAA
jgi:hypothetical protein